MTVTIVGTGLIGGSLALDLKERGFTERIIGVETDTRHAEQALRRGLVGEIRPLVRALADTDLMVLAVPVDTIAGLLPSLLDQADDRITITDTGSTKHNICESVKGHRRRGRFVASHPIAGTENSGPSAAMHGLFDHKAAILCDTGDSEEDAVALVRRMYDVLRMRVVCMGSRSHDRHMAYVSHVSHVVSFALATTVLDIEKSENMICGLASSGLDSTVRLAKSSPEMWAPILEQNAGLISEALDAYLSHLGRFKAMIDNRDITGVYEFMKKGNDIRRVLDYMTQRSER